MPFLGEFICLGIDAAILTIVYKFYKDASKSLQSVKVIFSRKFFFVRNFSPNFPCFEICIFMFCVDIRVSKL